VSKLLRAVAALVVAAVAVGQAGCESNNVGLLEDTKWSSAYVPDYKGISLRGMTISLAFHADGRFNMGLNAPLGSISIHGRWKLGSGDTVTLYDLSQALGGHTAHNEKVTIAGDTLTMADADGTKVVFTKIDKEMEKAAQKPVKPSYAPPSPVKKSKQELRDEEPGSYK
jgi:hypothetical protein